MLAASSGCSNGHPRSWHVRRGSATSMRTRTGSRDGPDPRWPSPRAVYTEIITRGVQYRYLLKFARKKFRSIFPDLEKLYCSFFEELHRYLKDRIRREFHGENPGNSRESFSREIALTVGERFGTRSDIIPGLFFILMTRASTTSGMNDRDS